MKHESIKSTPWHRFSYLLFGLLLVTGWAQAQELVKPDLGTSYLVAPDYRKCAFPMCGGWFLTPVNQYSVQLQTDNEAMNTAALLPNRIYVASINYQRLGLNKEQIAALEREIHAGQALLRGLIRKTSDGSRPSLSYNSLVATGAWVGANKTPAVGPYLRVSSTGIVCITTPCPYYKAQIINSDYDSEFHELNFEKAELDRGQESQAWQAVSSDGLIMTGVKYESKGMTGPGIGIAATKVYFPFPGKE